MLRRLTDQILADESSFLYRLLHQGRRDRKKVEAAHGSSLIITNERIRRWISSNESPSGRRDGSHQGRGVDLIGHGGLCQIDDCEEQELGVVEDRETLHLGSGKGE